MITVMKKKYIYLLSFFIPLITLICGMIYFGVAPFGDNSLLIIDGLHQYIPFFSVLYDKIRGGESLFYTFRTGLGINFLALFSYYLSSPMNLFIVLFPRTQLNMAVSFLIVLKLALSGLCASIYFTAKSRRPGFHIVAVSVAYALNGFMVGYCWNVMWLDAIMVLPLIILGIERLVDKKDGRLYCLALFYALYCNYYIAFMICIFSVIWYLFYSFKSVKQFFFRGLAFTLYSFLAAGMAALLLIPAYLGIKATASGSDMSLPIHSWIGSFWDLIARQYTMGYPITHDNFDGNANLYFGIFTIFFIFLYLTNRKINLVDKCKKVILLIFFYLSFNEEILNFIWHGFHNQYGIPNRFAFLYGFVLLTMVFEVMDHRYSVRILEPFLALLASGLILVGVIIYGEEEIATDVVASASLMLAVYLFPYVLMNLKRKQRAYFHFAMSSIIVAEMVVTSLLGFDTNGQVSISKFFSNTEDMEAAMEELEDGFWYRSELAEAKIVDESTYYPMKAISLFGSTAKKEMVDLMDSLGFYTGANEYLYKGGTPVSNLMFNVRYLFFHPEDSLFTDFNYVTNYGDMALYENPTEGMSIGYGISTDIDQWFYESDYPFRVLNDFTYQGYFIDNIFEHIEITDPLTNGCSASRTNDGEYYFQFDEKFSDNLVFSIDIEKSSDNLYLFYDGTQVENVRIMIDGLIVKQGDLDGQMICAGPVNQGENVQVVMSLKGELSNGYVRLSAASFDRSQYESLVNEMTSQAFEVTKHNDTHIEGKIDMIEEGYLFFSIPYDKGWTVKVDGKNVETTSIGNALLSVIIPEGEHEVVLDYTPEGFQAGLVTSGISVIVFLFICIYVGRRKKKADNKGGKNHEENRPEDNECSHDLDDDHDITDSPECEG